MTFISTCNEFCLLPVGSCKPKQDKGSVFKILPTCDRPCATSLSCINKHTADYNCHCCKLVNVVECHVCNTYCSKKGACRLSYPKLTVSSLYVQIIEKNSDNNDGKLPELYRKIEFHSKVMTTG